MSKYQKELLFKLVEDAYKDLTSKQLMMQEYNEEDRIKVLEDSSMICARQIQAA